MSEPNYGVWIEGGDRAGRWMTHEYHDPWSGSFEEASAAAEWRQQVHGKYGLTYTVREIDQPRNNP